MMYIEDIITKLTGASYFILSDDDFSTLAGTKEFQILVNLGEQLSLGNSLTEKQGMLALRILNKHQLILKLVVPEIVNALVNPSWKLKFRTLTTAKEIAIEEQEDPTTKKVEKFIIVRFPYDDVLVEKFRSRNRTVHELFRGTWEVRNRAWTFSLTEQNISYLGGLLNSEFSADAEFMNYHEQLSELHERLETEIPMLSKANGEYAIINAHKSIPQPNKDTKSSAEAAFFARRYGVTVWDDAVNAEISNISSDVTKKLLRANGKDRIWFDETSYSIDEFTDLINYGEKILIIIPGGSELTHTKNWVSLANSLGIDNKNISVMFRLPNERATFNEYVKDTGLNNPVNENTKIVFVSTKITKPLVKSGIHFTTVINLGYYNYMHFSMNAIMEGVCNVLFYSMKAPTERIRWQPQEL